jgi:4-hydroxybenzoate decarboxylase subunit C
MHSSLQSFLHTLRLEGELLTVDCSVDSSLEIAEIHRRVVKENGPALLFTNVKQSLFPVVTNLFGSEKRLRLALGEEIEQKLSSLVSILDHPSITTLLSLRSDFFSIVQGGKKWKKHPQVLTQELSSLEGIPFLKTWPSDGGSFLTLPLCYTQSPLSKKENLGMYRIQRYDATHAGLHWQLGKGGAFHYAEAQKLGLDLPVAIFLGGPPALILSSIIPLPENISEILLASLLMGKRIPMVECGEFSLIDACDVAILGKASAFEHREEGPFGDHFGYLDGKAKFPLFKLSKIFHKSNAIIPATVVGKPLQEDSYIGNYIQKLVRPFLSLIFPNLLDLHTYPETGFHPLTSICVKERYRKEALTTALKVLGDGQLSFTKILFVVDEALSLDDIKQVLPHLLERFNPEEDLLILPSTANDTLDMTGPKRHHGSKAIFFGTGCAKKRLPTTITSPLPSSIGRAEVFCPGCLVIDGVQNSPLEEMLQHNGLSDWPLVVLVDDAPLCASSPLEFLWTVFTRFEPAANLFAKSTRIYRNGVQFSSPLLIDARMKPGYNPPLTPSEETISLVDRRYAEYFPCQKPY